MSIGRWAPEVVLHPYFHPFLDKNKFISQVALTVEGFICLTECGLVYASGDNKWGTIGTGLETLTFLFFFATQTDH